MKNNIFLLEKRKEINNFDLLLFKKLYLPILGPNSFAIYTYLIDQLNNQLQFNASFNLSELETSLSITLDDFVEARQKLEGLGLIRTFISEETGNSILCLLKPLSFEKFLNNKFLKFQLVKRIGSIGLEKLYLLFKNKVNNKDSYIETTKKYSDFFDINEVSTEISNTGEIEIDMNISLSQAIEKYPSVLFIKYISKNNASSNERNMITFCSSLGFSDKAINELIKYSFTKNNRLVINFIKKIAQDFYEKDIISFNDVERELNFSIRKNNSFDPFENIWDNELIINNNNNRYKKNEEPVTSITEDVDIFDLIEDLKGLN
ncbi:MAG: DnaD domain protein [Metamycoplasmataceae bacterium]